MFENIARPSSTTRTVVFLAAGLISASPALAQNPRPSRAPAAHSSAPVDGTLPIAPQNAFFWLRVSGANRAAEQLENHPLALAYNALMQRGGRLARAIETTRQGLTRFAMAHGLSEAVLAQILCRDSHLAVFPRTTKAGKKTTDFVLVFALGEHSPIVQNALDALPSVDGESKTHRFEHPFGGTGILFGSIAAERLVCASSRAALHIGLDLVHGKTKSLASSPEFGLLNSSDEPHRAGWLRVFARPLETWQASGIPDSAPEAKMLLASGLSNLRAIQFVSEFRSGKMQDELEVLLPKTGKFPLDFLAGTDPVANHAPRSSATPSSSRPNKQLARMIPTTASAWLAAHIDPAGLSAFLGRTGLELGPLSAMDALGSEFAAGDHKKLEEWTAMLGSDVLWLEGEGDSAHGIVLMLQNSFAMRTLLASHGKPTKIPGGDAQKIFGFELENRGASIHVILCSDFLLASDSAKGALKLLERCMSGETSKDVTKLFANTDAWLIGSEDPSARLRQVDPTDRLGLTKFASHLDLARVRARRDGRRVSLRLDGATGMSHLTALALDSFVPSIVQGRERQREARVLTVADGLNKAEKSYVELGLLDRDEDGTGEPGTIADLIENKLWTAPKKIVTDGSNVLTGMGYHFTVVRPSDIELAEKHHIVVAWPAKPGVSGRASYVVRPDGSISMHPWLPDLNPDTGPTPAQIFESDPWAELAGGWQVQRAAPDETVARTGQPLSREELLRIQRTLDAARDAEDRKAIASLLSHSEPTIQARAAYYAGDLKLQDSVPLLARLLRESDHIVVRRNAARALSLIRDQKSKITLAKAALDTDPKVRLFAATALLGAKTPGARKALMELVDSYPADEAGDRTQAVLALADMNDPGVLEYLVATPPGGGKFQEAMLFAFQTLSPRLPAKQEQSLLIRALASKNKSLRIYAMQRLAKAGHTGALPTLIAQLEHETADLRPTLQLAIDALRLPTNSGFQSLVADTKLGAKRLYWKFRRLPAMTQKLVALSPAILLILVMLVSLVRRSRRRRASAARTRELAGPTPSLRGSAEQIIGDMEPNEADEVGSGVGLR